MTSQRLTGEELIELERLAAEAVPGPWKSYLEGRDHLAGDNFIMTGGQESEAPDMYVHLYYPQDVSRPVADAPTHDFIAACREAVPRLVAEVRRLRAESDPR